MFKTLYEWQNVPLCHALSEIMTECLKSSDLPYQWHRANIINYNWLLGFSSLIPGSPQTKRPIVKWVGYNTGAIKPSYEKQIKNYTNTLIYPLALTPLDLIVFDLDLNKEHDPKRHSGQNNLYRALLKNGVKKARIRELLDTYTVRTQSGGLHLYYKQPATKYGQIIGLLDEGSHIDIKGAKNYVIAPLSKGLKGIYTPIAPLFSNIFKLYTLDTIPVLPPELEQLIKEHLSIKKPSNINYSTFKPGAPAKNETERRNREQYRQQQLDAIRSSAIGVRNDILFKKAFSLFVTGYYNEQDLINDLENAGSYAGLEDNEIKATIASAQDKAHQAIAEKTAQKEFEKNRLSE